MFPEEEPKVRSAGFRYGFLAIILALLILSAFASSNHYYSVFIVPIMLLFNHLAFQFRWSRPVAIGLRACAYFWVMFGRIVIFYHIFTNR
jgi:hypothetical protein